jgi:DNA primase
MWQEEIKKNFKHKVDRNQIKLHICPYCSNNRYNLEINSVEGIYHCWVCGASGRIEKFFTDQSLNFDTTGWKPSVVTREEKDVEQMDLSLFKTVEYKANYKFLSGRGIEADDVSRYNLLTVDQGRYKDRLIIPLKDGEKYVYFVSRDMFPRGKYLNPVIDRKNLLLYYLGEDVSVRKRLYIVEGAFDAISVNKLGFSVAMLIGSSLSDGQIKKIKRIGFSDVVVCLDGDLKKKAVDMQLNLIRDGVNAKIILIPGNDDPNDLYVADKKYLKKILERPKEVTLLERAEMAMKG